MKKLIFILIVFSLTFTYAQDGHNYSVTNMKANSKNSDFGVTFYGDSLAVFASSRREKTLRNKIWIGNKQPFLELFKAEIDSAGDFKNIKPFSKKLNSKFHESNVAFTKDLSTVYFSRNNYFDKKLTKDEEGVVLIQMYKATVAAEGEWTNVTPMPFNSDEYQTGHPVLNDAQNKLYFVSDMPGSIGGTDIYYVDIYPDGTYSEPKNLGPNVNTPEKELFPFITKDNVLYFSSEGFGSKGGLDVFATKMVRGEAAYKPVNLGHPINTKADDFAFVFKPNATTGYLSSNRKGGRGDDDIYFFEAHNPVTFVCEQEVAGVVKEKGTGALLPGAMVELKDANGKVVSRTVADSFAAFTFNLDCESSYTVTGMKDTYEPDTKSVTTEEDNDVALNLELNLNPSEFVSLRGQLMININPIYFDLDKADIRPDAAIELEKVIRIMQKYPELKVDLGSHTDSRANNDYNIDLSQRRATSSRDWIIKRGIDGSRITAKGFGETQLVNGCADGVKCTEAEHQVNRRTEFVIVNPEVIK